VTPWSWKACALIVGVAVTIDVLIIQSPLVWIGAAGMLAIGAQFWGDLRSIAVVMFTCGLTSYSPFEFGVLSRLYPGDVAIVLFLIMWLVRGGRSCLERRFQPNLVNAPLFGMASVMALSILWSRLHPDPSVTYTFPHSDVSWATTQIAQLALLGATICIPFAVAATVKTRRDIEYVIITMGVVTTLGTLLTAGAMIYGLGGSFEILGVTRAYWEQPWQSSVRLTELVLPFLYSAVLFGRRCLPAYGLICVLFLFCLIGVVLTFSRQSWLVSLFTLFCVSAFWLRKKILIPLMLLLPCVLVLVASSPGVVKGVTQFYNPNEVYGLDRLYFYVTGVQLFVTHPLLGVGAGNYQFFDRIYAEVSAGGISHNQFITIAAETGIPGLFMFLWFLVALLRIPRRFKLRTLDRRDSLYWFRVAGVVFLLAWISECFFQEAFFVTAAAGGGTKVLTFTVFPWILLGLLFAVTNLSSPLARAAPDTLALPGDLH